jgi:4-hydroxy-tetrahydrodipicolinate synthase
MFSGCGTALVTPFRRDFSLDEATLKKLLLRQIEAGINFLSPCGTTGENPTLTREEHLRVVEITVAEAQGRVPVMGGAGGYNTSEIVALAKDLESLHVAGILSVAPYYNRPTQEGLYRHFKTIAEAVSIPVIIYNVPRRTGVNVEPETLVRLSEIANITGVKEASADISQMAAIIAKVPESFSVFSGDDAIALPLIALGGRGLISVVSNEIPAEMTSLVQHALRNDFAAARRLQQRYLPLMEVNFLETNPLPVKAAMAEMGLLEPVWRLPLCPPKPETVEKVRRVLESLELLGGKHAARAN